MKPEDNPLITMQSFIDTQEFPVVIIDARYKIVAANALYCSTYGISLKQVVGRTCHQVSHGSDVPCDQNGEDCPHRHVFETDQPFEVLHTHFDAAHRPDYVRIKAYPIHSVDNRPLLLETLTRITPQINAADANGEVMVGRSPAFLACLENLTVAAKSGAPLLLTGETGVGKDLAARFVHQRSNRSGGPYVSLNCAAIPEALFESELFGHERGAFTGSVGHKRGLFEIADGGSLFLDEIGELSLPAQAKLLRALDVGEFRRVGGKSVLKADVRLISATNRNLITSVKQENFREDFYHRIAGMKVDIPPLRSRAADIPLLAEVLLNQICLREKRTPCWLTPEAIKLLMGHTFPGNIRELRNILTEAVAISSDGSILAKHIRLSTQISSQFGTQPHTHRPLHTIAPNNPTSPHAAHRPIADNQSLAEMETHRITEILQQCAGNRKQAADLLGISERTLYRKILRYQLQS